MRRLLALMLFFPALSAAQDVLNVGSKRFTESYILGEIVTQAARAAGGAPVVHRRGLGNTGILFAALRSGAIDVYPEYTGTIAIEILGEANVPSLASLNRQLAPYGLAAGVPLGFGNAYALAMRETDAATRGITVISDLVRHPELSLGLSQEFLNRKDGWPALRAAYRLDFAPRGLDHGLAYEALEAGRVDIIDVYTTDAKLARHRLRVLIDDRKFFPAYDAVLLYRRDLSSRFPRSWSAIEQLEGRISGDDMIALNAQAELRGVPFTQVASAFLEGRRTPPERSGGAERRGFLRAMFAPDFLRLTMEHLVLVLVSLAMSVAAGVPFGIWGAKSARAGRWILASAGVAQTIPSLALLAFLIPLTGTIGVVPALIALFLYGLLPIVRNTVAGLAGIAPPVNESARALGLSAWARLRHVELPLAARPILAGIKTSAVISVGTATIAALIGAGGYGERIVAGLAVHDNTLLLAGAIPAALLALVMQWGFDALDRWAIPRGLQEDADNAEAGG